MWNVFKGIASALLELTGHESHVNSLVFDANGGKMYSGDGFGIIKVWAGEFSATNINFGCVSTVSHFKSTTINSLFLHPTGRYLLVLTRSSILCSLDIRFLNVRKQYLGLTNKEWPLKSEFSPDGNFVLSGSEDSKMFDF